MRVKRVTRITLSEPIPVYDIEVPGNHNFQLASGPFVHNSKDCADSVCGVIAGLTMRREIWARHQIPVSAQLVNMIKRYAAEQKALQELNKVKE